MYFLILIQRTYNIKRGEIGNQVDTFGKLQRRVSVVSLLRIIELEGLCFLFDHMLLFKYIVELVVARNFFWVNFNI